MIFILFDVIYIQMHQNWTIYNKVRPVQVCDKNVHFKKNSDRDGDKNWNKFYQKMSKGGTTLRIKIL